MSLSIYPDLKKAQRVQCAVSLMAEMYCYYLEDLKVVCLECHLRLVSKSDWILSDISFSSRKMRCCVSWNGCKKWDRAEEAAAELLHANIRFNTFCGWRLLLLSFISLLLGVKQRAQE